MQSNHPCDKVEHELHNLKNKIHTNRTAHQPTIPVKPEYKKRYLVTIKTEDKLVSGSDPRIDITLYDDQNQNSGNFPLDNSITNKHPFQKNQIDQFHMGTLTKLSDLAAVRLQHRGDEKIKWNFKWIQIQDLDTQRLYCFPLVIDRKLNILSFVLPFSF